MELSEKLKRFDDINEVLYKSKDRTNCWILNNSNIINDFIETLSSEELTSELFELYIYDKLKSYYEQSHDTEALFKSLNENDRSKMVYFFYIHGMLANNGNGIYNLDKNVSEKMYDILKNILLKNKYYYVWFQLDDINANNILAGRNRWSNTPFNDNALSYILRHTIGDNRFNYLLMPNTDNLEEVIVYDNYSDIKLVTKNRLAIAEKVLDEFLSLETEHKICSDVVVRAICDVVLQYSLNAKQYVDRIKESKSVIFSSYSNFNILATNKNISDEDSRSIIAQSFRQKDINKYIKSLRESKDMNIIAAFLDGGIYNNTRIRLENRDKRAMEILTAVLIGTPSRYYNDPSYSFKNNKEFWNKYPNLRTAMEDYCINAIYAGTYGKVETCVVLLCKMYSNLNIYEYFKKFTRMLDTRIKDIDPHLRRYLIYLPSYVAVYNNIDDDDINNKIDDVISFENIEKIYFNILKEYKNDPDFANIFSKYFKYTFNYLTSSNNLSNFFNDIIRRVFNKEIKMSFGPISGLYSYLMKKYLLSISTLGQINKELNYPLKDSYLCEYENILERNFFNDRNGFNSKNNVFTDPSMLIAYALKDICLEYNNDVIDNITFNCPEEFIFAPNIQFVGSKMMFYSKTDVAISGEITKNMYSIFNNINKMLYILNLYLTDFDNYQTVLTSRKTENIENYLLQKGFKYYPMTSTWWGTRDKIYYNEDLHIAITTSDLYNYSTLFSATSIFNRFTEIKQNIARKYLDFLASDNFINTCTLEWLSLYSDMKNKGTFNPDFDKMDYSDRYASGDSIKYEIHFNDSYYTFLEKFIKSLHVNQIIELSGIDTEFTEEYLLNRLNENRPEIELAATVMN